MYELAIHPVLHRSGSEKHKISIVALRTPIKITLHYKKTLNVDVLCAVELDGENGRAVSLQLLEVPQWGNLGLVSGLA